MSDNEDWRRRKAEELGLHDTGPWPPRTVRPSAPAAQPAPAAGTALRRAPDSGVISVRAQGDAAERMPTPIPTRSDIPDDSIHVDRRRRAAATPAEPPAREAHQTPPRAISPTPPVPKLSDVPNDATNFDRRRRLPAAKPHVQPAANPAAASLARSVTRPLLPASALRGQGARAAAMLAVVGGLVLALAFGWWLRGAAPTADFPHVFPTTAAPSTGTAAPAAVTGPLSSDADEAATEAMVDSLPAPARGSISSAAALPPAEYAPVSVPDLPAALAPASSPPVSSLDTRPPSANMPARPSLATGDEPDAGLDRQGAPRARLAAPRGRFTAPRAVAAQGRNFSPSFNCRRATSWVNRLVCNDEELAALDVRMSDAYGRAIAAADPAGERHIDADQADFLRQRTLCSTAACVDLAYRIRIDELAPLN